MNQPKTLLISRFKKGTGIRQGVYPRQSFRIYFLKTAEYKNSDKINDYVINSKLS